MSAFRSVFWVYVLSYLAAPLGYAIRILFSRTLPLEQFGLFYSIVGFFSLVLMVSGLGSSVSLQYHVAKCLKTRSYKKIRGFFRIAYTIEITTFLIIAFVLILCKNYLVNDYFGIELAGEAFWFFLIHAAVITLTRPFNSLIVGIQKTTLSVSLDFVKSFMVLAISSLLLFVSFAFLPWLAWLVAGIIVLILSSSYCLIKHHHLIFGPADTKDVKPFITYALHNVAGVASTIFLYGIDLQFITGFLTLEDVAYYSNAYAIANILVILITPINVFLLPYIANKKKPFEAIKSTYRFLSLLFVPLLLYIFFFSKQLVLFFFGTQFVDSSIILYVLSPGLFFVAIANVFFSILNGLGKVLQKNIVIWISAVLNVILNFSLVQFGTIGIAISTTISFSVMGILSYFLIIREVGFFAPINMRILIIYGILAGYLIFLSQVLSFSLFTNLAIAGLSLYALHGILLLLFGLLTKKDLSLIKELKP